MSVQRAALGWNTWDNDFPTHMVYGQLGVRVEFNVYANKSGTFNRFPAGDRGIRLGTRTIDANPANFTIAHAGTALSVGFDRDGENVLRGAWQTSAFGEWGLRFWVLVCVYARDTGVIWSYDEDTGLLQGTLNGQQINVASARRPLLCTFHNTAEMLAKEIESEGYWYLDSRDAKGPLAALRFNLEEMPSNRFAVGINETPKRLQHCITAEPPALREPDALHFYPSKRQPGALEAVRDVIAWNTVFDERNKRRYTALSRNWGTQKFGGFGVWMNDILFHALLAATFDTELAKDNLHAVLSGATEQGNIPCLLTGRDSWIDRSQPPIASFIVWLIYTTTGDAQILEEWFTTLLRNHRWWWRERDGNANGLLEYGSSAIGRGLYRGTKLAAKDESMMDNSPMHDEAVFVRATGTLDCEDVGLNSLLALDGEMLARMAERVGEHTTCKALREESEALKKRIITHLWDDSRNTFANRLWSGQFVKSVTPTSFFPLLAGAATETQARHMVEQLSDPTKFSGPVMLPSVHRNDPAYTDNVYWRGRVWPPLNFLTYHGLRRSGFDSHAFELASNSYATFAAAWQSDRACGENYNAETAEVHDQADTDGFYGWGALMALLGAYSTAECSPWHGLEITNAQPPQHMGPMLTPLGRTVVERDAGCLCVRTDDAIVFETNIIGRFRNVKRDTNALCLTIAPGEGGWICIPSSTQAHRAELDGNLCEPERSDGRSARGRFLIPASTKAQTLVIIGLDPLDNCTSF